MHRRFGSSTRDSRIREPTSIDPRIAHRVACPYLPRDDSWPWTPALRRENERRAQRLFNLPDDWALPDAG
ncbi:DUF6083 domain-containing protein [Streptomyces sp. NPDC088183]|uniref:DUF6083 domain-containing protein n=1 Tax=Streptomyces sp. NPDC088183 TaxID=3160992 RepID=UPI003436EDB9